MKLRIILISSFLSCLTIGFSQQRCGKIVQKTNNQVVSEVQILDLNTSLTYTSDADGNYCIQSNAEKLLLQFSKPGFENTVSEVSVNAEGQLNPVILQENLEEEITTIDGLEKDSEQDDADVFSMLNSSDDKLFDIAAYNLGDFRFRIRGYENEWNSLSFNQFNFKDPDSGFMLYDVFSGLNNLTRFGKTNIGWTGSNMHNVSSALGQSSAFSVSGSRQGLFLNLGITNRSYRNRVTLSYGSKVLKHNIRCYLEYGRRWAQEGYYPGTSYDSHGYIAGISKKWKNISELQLLVFGNATTRGKNSPGILQVYELANDNYYNSYWGRQAGEIRNAREAIHHIPTINLDFKHAISDHMKLQFAALGFAGNRKDTELDWSNSGDPRPDYYQKLPYSIADPEVNSAITEKWHTDEKVRQVDWDQLYLRNKSLVDTIENANGIVGNSISGLRSAYILSARNADVTNLQHFGALTYNKNRIDWNVSYHLMFQNKSYFRSIEDLLGGDYYYDINDFAPNSSLQDHDLNTPNKVVREGGAYEFKYDLNQSHITLASNLQFKTKRIDYHISGRFNPFSAQRDGAFKNAIYPESFGKSEKYEGSNYGVQAGLTYKVNGRNYIQLVAGHAKKMPEFSLALISPQNRNDIYPDIPGAINQGAELNYFYRSPKLKARASVYYSTITDQLKHKTLYIDENFAIDGSSDLFDGGLVNIFLTGLDELHQGYDLSAELDLIKGFSVNAAIFAGDHIYTSRPNMRVYSVDSKEFNDYTIYLKNFYVPGTPQIAGSFGVTYDNRKIALINLQINYVDKNYIDVFPFRRTSAAVTDVEKNSSQYRSIIDQEQLPSAVTLDLFLLKRLYFGSGSKYINTTLSINNLLNDRGILSNGFEQYRFDFTNKTTSTFPNKYYYLKGINYFLGLSYKF